MSTPNDPLDPNAGGQPGPASSGSGTPQPGSPQPGPSEQGSPQYGPPQSGTPYPSAPQYPQYPSGQYGASPYGQPYGQPYGYPKNSVGVWALVLGILSVTFCGCLSGIPAIIVGYASRRAAAAGEANNGGMGTAGVVLGWISVALTVLSLVWLFLLGGWAWYMETLESSTRV